MPNRAPTLGNSIMQMAMQNRQLNLQANQSFQQGAQQDAMLRSGLLNMLMGDNLSRDQMAEQSSQFNRDLGFRQRVHGDDYRLSLDKFDQAKTEFDTMAGLEDRRVGELETAGKHNRGYLDKTFDYGVAEDNYTRAKETRTLLSELMTRQSSTNQQRRVTNYRHGTNLPMIDNTDQREALINELAQSGLGVNRGLLDNLSDWGNVGTGDSLDQISSGAVRSSGGQQASQPSGSGAGTASGGSSFPGADLYGGMLGRLTRPLDSQRQGAFEFSGVKKWIRSANRTVLPFIYGNDQEQIEKVIGHLESGAKFIDHKKNQQVVREVQDIIMDQGAPWYKIEGEATRTREQELNAKQLQSVERLTYESALNQILERDGITFDEVTRGHIIEAQDYAFRPERRGVVDADMEMNYMLKSMNEEIMLTGTDDIVRTLDDKGAAMAVKLEQIERKFLAGEYNFLTKDEHDAFRDKLKSIQRTIGRLGDSDPSAQMQLQQEAEAGGSGNTWMDLLLTPPAGRLGPWKLF